MPYAAVGSSSGGLGACSFTAEDTPGSLEVMLRFLLVTVLALFVVGVAALAAQDGGGEHGGGEEHAEGGGIEGGEGGGGGEGEESGEQYGPNDIARQHRGGVDLVIRYDRAEQAFIGTVLNTTAAPIADVRVEVHLSNGVELGPTPRRDLAPGAMGTVRLDARVQMFDRWSVHVEIGQSEVPVLPTLELAALAALLVVGGARRLTTAATIAVLVFAVGCGDSRTEPSGLEHGPEGGGGEAGEGGTRYGLSETARESRAGVDLEMRYSSGAAEFTGTVTNTTAATVRDVRVEIHLSNGVELGPTARRDLAAGEVAAVRLDAAGQTFTWWSVHVELGAGSGS